MRPMECLIQFDPTRSFAASAESLAIYRCPDCGDITNEFQGS
jgi:hypothetical protein